MVDMGMLCKIARNIYHIIPLNEDPESYLPDKYQMANYIMLNKEYYIGYSSALKLYGLRFQSEPNASEAKASEPNASEANVHVVTLTRMKPTIQSFGGIAYHFIQHDATRFFGFDPIWIDPHEQAMVSDLEKTIVDIATKPQLCGGIIELAYAISRAKDRVDQDKLFYYFARNMNVSAKKRFLFLTDLLSMEWSAEHKKMKEELGSGISLLDPLKANQGSINKDFGLKINVDPKLISQKVLN